MAFVLGTETGAAITTESGAFIGIESNAPVETIANPPQPLQTIIPAYPYQQYADDPNIVAFFNAYNTLAQQYLAWFNASPFAVYTLPTISGPLLDWIGNGIYGIARPTFTALLGKYVAGLNSSFVNRKPVDGFYKYKFGYGTLSSDDFYKRVLTWWFYLGDGRRFTIMSLRRKIARFIYGVDGGDITLSQVQSISITLTGFTEYAIKAGTNSAPINAVALNWHKPHTAHLLALASGQYLIEVPAAAGAASFYFQQAFDQGILAFPFQYNATVIVA